MDFPGDSGGKESACNARDLGLIPGLGRSPGGGHGDPLQYSCLEKPSMKNRIISYIFESLIFCMSLGIPTDVKLFSQK